MGEYVNMIRNRFLDAQRKLSAVEEKANKEVDKEANKYAAQKLSPEIEEGIKSQYITAVTAWYGAYEPKKYQRTNSLYDVMKVKEADGIFAGWEYYDDGLTKPSLWGGTSFNIYDLVFEGGFIPVGKGQLPKELWCQNDCGRERPRYKYDFPLTDDNFGETYFEVEKTPETWKEKSALSPANVKDEVNLKFKALCPKANEEARANYLRDKESDPYKRSSTVPYTTFGEFLKKQDKLSLGKEERGAL